MPATVGLSNRCRIGRSRPSTERIRPASRVASREWPPSSKKLSSMVTDGRSSTSANSWHSTSSRGLRGLRPVGSSWVSGSGSAL